jgi:hypothetical protein
MIVFMIVFIFAKRCFQIETDRYEKASSCFPFFFVFGFPSHFITRSLNNIYLCTTLGFKEGDPAESSLHRRIKIDEADFHYLLRHWLFLAALWLSLEHFGLVLVRGSKKLENVREIIEEEKVGKGDPLVTCFNGVLAQHLESDREPPLD